MLEIRDTSSYVHTMHRNHPQFQSSVSSRRLSETTCQKQVIGDNRLPLLAAGPGIDPWWISS